jgi:capsular exopolysaccharide synthesis family protein
MLDPRGWVPVSWLRDLGVLPPPPPEPSAADLARVRKLAVIDAINAGLGLRPIEGSRVMEMSFTIDRPDLAAKVVNTIAEQYIADRTQAKRSATAEATSWLEERVGELRRRVVAAEEAVDQARAQLAEAHGQGSEVLHQQLGDLTDELANVRARRTELEARYERVAAQLRDGSDVAALVDFRESTEIGRLRERLRELRANEATLLDQVEPTHPSVVQVRRRLSTVGEELRAEARRVADALRAELDIIETREATLTRQVRELEAQTIDRERFEVRLRQLEREADASRAVFDNALARLNETTRQADIQQADARILSRAEKPTAPDAARKTSILAASGVVGTLGGIGLVFLREKLNDTFRLSRDLETHTGCPLLASLPLAPSRHRSDIVGWVLEEPRCALAEAVRDLRTSILLSDLDDPPQVVMVASSAPVEGKTTASVLLAMTSAALGRSVVAVDCDLRKPWLTSLIRKRTNDHEGTDPPPGDLVSVLEGSATLGDALIRDPQTGLNVLTTRSVEANAADILGSRRFAELVDGLRARFDLVLLDTPPVLAVTDARIVSTVADAVLMMVRWDETPRRAVVEAFRDFRSVEAPVIGNVFTMVDERQAATYADGVYSFYRSEYRKRYETT